MKHSHHSPSALLTGLMLALIFLAGCVSTRPASSEEDFQRLTRRGATNTARITLSNGEVMRVRGLIIEADSASWRRVQDRGFQRVPVHDLREVRYRAAKGILHGLGIGLLVGAVVGQVIVLDSDYDARMQSSCSPTEWCLYPPKEMMAAASVITYSLTGLIIGASSKDRYIIIPDRPTPPSTEEQDGASGGDP